MTTRTITPLHPTIFNRLARALCARLVVQTLIDLQQWEVTRTREPSQNQRLMSERRQHRQNALMAIAWLAGSFSSRGISFRECCELLAQDPDQARRKLLAQVDPAALAALGVVETFSMPAGAASGSTDRIRATGWTDPNGRRRPKTKLKRTFPASNQRSHIRR